MTNAEYRKAEGISRSDLFKFAKSPLHYKYAKEHPAESTAALTFGSAAHKWILEKDDFYNEYVVAPNVDKRTKEGKEIWNTFLKLAEGKTVISVDDFETIVDMGIAIDEHPFARKFLEGEHEVSLFWTDADTGEKVKCRPDSMTTFSGKEIDDTLEDRKLIVDYKTTDSLEDGHFERSCRNYGYKLQAGMYREGVFQNFLEDYGFAFVCQEKKPPYAVRVYVCTEEYIQSGFDEYKALMAIYHKCKTENRYPSYEGFDAEFDYLWED